MTLLSISPKTQPNPSPWSVLRLRLVQFDTSTREQTHLAAEEFGISAELIASVLADEFVRRDGWDLIQEGLVRLGLHLQSQVARRYWQMLEAACGRPVTTFSLGRAQMKTGTLRSLGALGYLSLPETTQEELHLLFDVQQAPRLVAACLRATADHWALHGVSIEHRADVLATLYSLGLSGTRGVHPAPEASARGQAIAQHANWLATTTFREVTERQADVHVGRKIAS
jgi:hypothetical protein